MKVCMKAIFVFALTIYFFLFSFVDSNVKNGVKLNDYYLPAKLQETIFGYCKQFAAETLFVKTSVFLGGLNTSDDEQKNRYALENNFDVITEVYPQFIDPYFYVQSFLAPLSKESTKAANSILQRAIEIYPDNFVFRFFYAFNFFEFLDDPLAASLAFHQASELSGAPPVFSHLAVVFSAGGGDIKTSLSMLETMEATETNDSVKKRYQEEIVCLQKARLIENAVEAYSFKYGTAPIKLSELIPEFMIEIPVIDNYFILSYDPPAVRLLRP